MYSPLIELNGSGPPIQWRHEFHIEASLWHTLPVEMHPWASAGVGMWSTSLPITMCPFQILKRFPASSGLDIVPVICKCNVALFWAAESATHGSKRVMERIWFQSNKHLETCFVHFETGALQEYYSYFTICRNCRKIPAWHHSGGTTAQKSAITIPWLLYSYKLVTRHYSY